MILSDLVGIIADDLTGANDTALQFHKRGANTKILLDSECAPKIKTGTEVWALSSESRNVDAEEAVSRVEKAVKTFTENFSFEYYYNLDIDTTQLDEAPVKPNILLMNGITDFRIVNRLGNKCHASKIHLFADAPAYSSYADIYAWSKKILQSEYVAIAARPDQELDTKKKVFYVYPSVNYARIFANMLKNFGSLCYPPAGATYGNIVANDLLKCDYLNFADEMKTYRMNYQLSDRNGTVMWEQRTTYALNTDLSYIAPVFIVDDLSDQLITYERMFNFRYTSRTDLLNQESGITDILDGFVNKGFIYRYELVVPSYEEAQKAGRTLTIKIGVAIAKDSEVINIELELLSA